MSVCVGTANCNKQRALNAEHGAELIFETNGIPHAHAKYNDFVYFDYHWNCDSFMSIGSHTIIASQHINNNNRNSI